MADRDRDLVPSGRKKDMSWAKIADSVVEDIRSSGREISVFANGLSIFRDGAWSRPQKRCPQHLAVDIQRALDRVGLKGNVQARSEVYGALRTDSRLRSGGSRG